MFTENIKHKITTKNQERRDHEKNGHKHQYQAENDGQEIEFLSITYAGYKATLRG